MTYRHEPGVMGCKKASVVQVKMIVEEIATMIIDMYTARQIIRHCSEKYKIGSRQTEKYMQRAQLQINEVLNSSLQENLSKQLNALMKLYRTAGDDKRTKMAALKEINELLRLKTIQVEMSGVLNVEIMDENKLLKIIEERNALEQGTLTK